MKRRRTRRFASRAGRRNSGAHPLRCGRRRDGSCDALGGAARASDGERARHADRRLRPSGRLSRKAASGKSHEDHRADDVYEDNTVQKIKTALANLKSIIDVPENFRSYLEMARSFSPDIVISD